MLRKLRTLLLCFALGFGSLIGLPMRPEEITELMHAHNRPRIAHVLREEQEKTDP
jgi:hypothetical protein